MKILFLTDNFPPEVNAPASRTYEHAKRWVKLGAEVTVITCAPNFPQGVVHNGYRNAWRTVENIDGIRVVRVKTYITGNEGFGRRILDYLSFMASSFLFGLFEKRPDVIVGTSPQFFAAVSAWMLSVAKWRPFVFELRDLWPASIVTVGAMKKGIAIRALEQLELFLYRRAAKIVSVTESFKEDLAGRGIDPNKIAVVRNGVDLDKFQPKPKSEEMAAQLGVSGKFVVAYLGTHGMAHALGNVLDTAELMKDETGVSFLFVGDGAEKDNLVNDAASRSLSNVAFHGMVPKNRMPDVWSVCDVALVHLKDDPVFATVIPSKIFEAFGMGKPILIVQPNGEASNIVRDAGAGEWVQPGDPVALRDVILNWACDEQMVKQFGRASLDVSKSNSRDGLAAEMFVVLRKVAFPDSN